MVSGRVFGNDDVFLMSYSILIKSFTGAPTQDDYSLANVV